MVLGYFDARLACITSATSVFAGFAMYSNSAGEDHCESPLSWLAIVISDSPS